MTFIVYALNSRRARVGRGEYSTDIVPVRVMDGQLAMQFTLGVKMDRRGPVRYFELCYLDGYKERRQTIMDTESIEAKAGDIVRTTITLKIDPS